MREVRDIGQKVSNWGRWGDSDQRGALNLIGPEQIQRAAKLVIKGETFSLGINLDAGGPLPLNPPVGSRSDRRNPVHIMTELGHAPRERGELRSTDDWLMMPIHGATHWDALSHIILDGTIYNGFDAAEFITPTGATRCAIDVARDGVVARGVLLDVARHRGVPHLECGEVIPPDELDAVAEAQGVTIEPGDVLLIRTGWWEKYLADGSREDFWAGEPGPGIATAAWLRGHDVAAIAADNFSVEAVAAQPDGWASPEIPDQAFTLHVLLTRYLGMLVGELFDLTALAEACAADRTYEFLFCAPPLRISGGVGSPINPLAVK
jgi:kynurenine formamidase